MVTFHLNMSYEVAQIFTVTLYYMNSVFNPIIYFCVHPRVKKQLSGHLSRGLSRSKSHSCSKSRAASRRGSSGKRESKTVIELNMITSTEI